VKTLVAYIDGHRDRFGVEPICRVLSGAGAKIAPSTYWSAKSRPPSARARRDAVLLPILLALWMANYQVYGARKLWKAARRAGHDVGRDQVARLMRTLGIQGVRRGRRWITTRRDDRAARAPDLVKRDFTAIRPNQLWVTDLTFVATWSGVAYVCFIVDAFSRMIVGWRVASNMGTTMVLDALEMAAWSRGTRLEGLRCHSDAGSQGGLNWSSQHLEGGGVGWGRCGSGSGRCSCIEVRSLRLGLPRSRGVRTGSGSGRRSLRVSGPRSRRRRRGCHPRLGSGGSVTLAV
jgi:putative transposase